MLQHGACASHHFQSPWTCVCSMKAYEGGQPEQRLTTILQQSMLRHATEVRHVTEYVTVPQPAQCSACWAVLQRGLVSCCIDTICNVAFSGRVQGSPSQSRKSSASAPAGSPLLTASACQR